MRRNKKQTKKDSLQIGRGNNAEKPESHLGGRHKGCGQILTKKEKEEVTQKRWHN